MRPFIGLLPPPLIVPLVVRQSTLSMRGEYKKEKGTNGKKVIRV